MDQNPSPQPRVMVSFTVKPGSKDWLDDLAHAHRVGRSTVIRVALAIAKRHEAELVRAIEEAS